MSAEFRDNSIIVKEVINEAAIAFLHEAAGELQSQVQRNTKVDTGDTKGAWARPGYKVDEIKLVAYVGNPKENAVWEEFGTGEYALKGDGHVGYWVYVKGSGSKNIRSSKSYTLNEAKRVMAILRQKGLEAYYTKGKRPKRTFFHAYNSLKPKIIRRAKEIFKGAMK